VVFSNHRIMARKHFASFSSLQKLRSQRLSFPPYCFTWLVLLVSVLDSLTSTLAVTFVIPSSRSDDQRDCWRRALEEQPCHDVFGKMEINILQSIQTTLASTVPARRFFWTSAMFSNDNALVAAINFASFPNRTHE
jgi:hypothetical protein